MSSHAHLVKAACAADGPAAGFIYDAVPRCWGSAGSHGFLLRRFQCRRSSARTASPPPATEQPFRMLPLPPVTQALMLICTAVFFVDHSSCRSRSVAVRAVAAGQRALRPLATVELRLPARRRAAPVLQHARPVDVRLPSSSACGASAATCTCCWPARCPPRWCSCCSTWWSGSRTPTVGASGALFGLLLCYGVLFPNRTIMPLFPPIPMKARTFVIVFGAWSCSWACRAAAGVAHFAHLGGMLGAWLMLLYWRGRLPFGRRR